MSADDPSVGTTQPGDRDDVNAGSRDTEDESGDAETDSDPVELRSRLEIVEAENRRLRRELGRAHQTRHRRTAIALVLIGVGAILGGVVSVGPRQVMIALGGTALVAGILTYYLTPERVIAASVGEAIYEAFAENHTALVTHLGLSDERIYLPVDSPAFGAESAVRLFVPQHPDYAIPAPDPLQDVFVISDTPEERGVSLQPSGATLFAEFQRTVDSLDGDETRLAENLAEAIVEQFELADAATPDVTPTENQALLAIEGSAYGPIDRFDHPIISFFAVGLATALGTPVAVSVTTPDDDTDALARYTWTQGDGRDTQS